MKKNITYRQLDEKYCSGPQQMVAEQLCSTYEIDSVVTSTYNNVKNGYLKNGICYPKKSGNNLYIFNKDEGSIRIKLDKEDPHNSILKSIAPTRAKFIAKTIGSTAIVLVVGAGVGLGAINVLLDAHDQKIEQYNEERQQQLKNMDPEQAQDIIDYEKHSQEINARFPDLEFNTLTRTEQDELINNYNYNGDSAIYDFMDNMNSPKTRR